MVNKPTFSKSKTEDRQFSCLACGYANDVAITGTLAFSTPEPTTEQDSIALGHEIDLIIAVIECPKCRWYDKYAVDRWLKEKRKREKANLYWLPLLVIGWLPTVLHFTMATNWPGGHPLVWGLIWTGLAFFLDASLTGKLNSERKTLSDRCTWHDTTRHNLHPIEPIGPMVKEWNDFATDDTLKALIGTAIMVRIGVEKGQPPTPGHEFYRFARVKATKGLAEGELPGLCPYCQNRAFYRLAVDWKQGFENDKRGEVVCEHCLVGVVTAGQETIEFAGDADKAVTKPDITAPDTTVPPVTAEPPLEIPIKASYSARCIFMWEHNPEDESENYTYEERITLWQAENIEQAIEMAEAEAEHYESETNRGYLGFCEVYAMASPINANGIEVFSLLRQSPLEAKVFIQAFFSDGCEAKESATTTYH